jgi:hypothetical protein
LNSNLVEKQLDIIAILMFGSYTSTTSHLFFRGCQDREAHATSGLRHKKVMFPALAQITSMRRNETSCMLQHAALLIGGYLVGCQHPGVGWSNRQSLNIYILILEKAAYELQNTKVSSGTTL